jgi:small subunit ribosomal protein S20
LTLDRTPSIASTVLPPEASASGQQAIRIRSRAALKAVAVGITTTDPTNPFEDEAGTMANTKSAKKAARQAVRRTEVNKSRTTRARSAVREVEEAIKAGNKSAAKDALKSAQPVLASTAQKGVIDRKAASRKVSRLSARVKAMAD